MNKLKEIWTWLVGAATTPFTEAIQAPMRSIAYLTLGVVVALTVVLLIRSHEQPAAVPVGVTVKATPAKEVANVPKVDVQVQKPLKVYAGGQGLKSGLKLPAPVVQNHAEQVIASSKVEAADDHPHTVTTVINTDTGQSETYVRTDPLPWIAWSSRGGIGMYAGIKNGTPAVRLQAEQELFTVKAIHFGAVASVDQPIGASPQYDQEWFVGIGAKYEW